jgi:hypothetical protein
MHCTSITPPPWRHHGIIIVALVMMMLHHHQNRREHGVWPPPPSRAAWASYLFIDALSAPDLLVGGGVDPLEPPPAPGHPIGGVEDADAEEHLEGTVAQRGLVIS